MAKIRPLGDKIVLEQLEEDEITKSGIVLPESAKEKPQKAKVIAVGPGRVTDEGKKIPIGVKVGDVVLYTKYGPTEIKLDGKEYLVVSESDILGIVEA